MYQMFYALGAYKLPISSLAGIITESYFLLEVRYHIMYRFMPIPGCLLGYSIDSIEYTRIYYLENSNQFVAL